MRHPWIAVAVALGACAQPQPGADLPLARAAIEPDAPAAPTGEARIPVTAVTDAGASVAAACVATGEGFRAEFTAPASVAVPSFGRESSAVRVDCASAGLRGSRVAMPTARPINGLGGWPAVGVGVSSGGGSYVSLGGFWNAGWGNTGPETYEVRYPAVEVALR